MPADIPLTPEAAAVVAAFDAVMDVEDSTGLYEDSRRALAAALRELAAVATVKTTAGGYVLSADIGAIADSIENAITYAPVEAPTDA